MSTTAPTETRNIAPAPERLSSAFSTPRGISAAAAADDASWSDEDAATWARIRDYVEDELADALSNPEALGT
mgnify:CR=1 FL=1